MVPRGKEGNGRSKRKIFKKERTNSAQKGSLVRSGLASESNRGGPETKKTWLWPQDERTKKTKNPQGL